MKRLLFVVVLTLCLSFPAFAGHTVAGEWCQCSAPGCLCGPGEQSINPVTDGALNKPAQHRPVDVGSETLLVLAVLLLVLRYKA